MGRWLRHHQLWGRIRLEILTERLRNQGSDFPFEQNDIVLVKRCTRQLLISFPGSYIGRVVTTE